MNNKRPPLHHLKLVPLGHQSVKVLLSVAIIHVVRLAWKLEVRHQPLWLVINSTQACITDRDLLLCGDIKLPLQVEM